MAVTKHLCGLWATGQARDLVLREHVHGAFALCDTAMGKTQAVGLPAALDESTVLCLCSRVCLYSRV